MVALFVVVFHGASQDVFFGSHVAPSDVTKSGELASFRSHIVRWIYELMVQTESWNGAQLSAITYPLQCVPVVRQG